MSKKVLLGFAMFLMLAFSFVIPAFASIPTEGEEVKVSGTIQSVDPATGSFTVLADDGTSVVVYAPAGFDLTLLVVGDQIKVEGTIGPDGLFAASQIELQDGTEFEVDDDTGEIEETEAPEIEDDQGEDIQDQDETEIENDDEQNVSSGEVESDNGGDSGGEIDD